jgi:hypothetical protein
MAPHKGCIAHGLNNRNLVFNPLKFHKTIEARIAIGGRCRKTYVQSAMPGFRQADGLRAIAKVKLCVFHLGFRDESVFANIVHETGFFCDLFSADFLLLAGLVVLHRGSPYIAVLADEVKVTLFTLNFFFSNFGSHLNTSKPLLGFDNEN